MSTHRLASLLLAITGSLALACGGENVSPVDGGPPDGGPPTEAQCALDPLLPGCTPAERPAFAGLSASVEIVRDADGVPHVFAANTSDAMYASGYMQAFDRLFQLDMSRRRALGRRAEVLGEGYVDDDRLVRIMDIPRWARTNEASLFREHPELWALVQAWTEGVNARIREAIAMGELPEELATLGYQPEEWSVSDGFAFGKLVLFGNANQLEYTILSQVIFEFLPDLDGRLGLTMPMRDSYVMPPDERVATTGAHVPLQPRVARELPPDAAQRLLRWQSRVEDFRSGGSNNWAIEGRHSATGRPLIAGDPHQPLDSPSLFWLHHLSTSDGALDVAGFNFVGGPAIQLGHNRDVAWTATTNYGDMMDLWDVRVDGDVVHAADQDVTIVRRTETIEVAGRDPVEVVCEDVPGRGVLLPEDLSPLPIGRPGRRLLFDWTGFGVTHELEGFWGFDTATSRDDFEAAVDHVELGLFNFVSADANGISYRSSPRIPDRGVPSDARRPFLLLDGDDPSTFWDGTFLDAARLPHSRGGSRGWIVSANNEPFGFSADGRISGDPWYFGMLFDPGVRSARIESEIERLVARGNVTIDEMMALQDDTYSLFADDYLPVLEEVWASVDTDPMLAAFRDRADLDALVASLSSWDRRMERTASEPVVFNAFMFFLARRVLADDLSIVFEPIMSAETTYIFKCLSNVVNGRAPMSETFFAGEARQLSVAMALDQTAAWLAERFPSGTYTWADFHGARFSSLYGDRLDGGWVPTDGSVGTVNVSNAEFFDSGMPRMRLESGGGSLYRMVATFRDDGTPEAFVNVTRGVSGDPTSVHWDDLESDWVENRYRRLRFTRAEIEADPVERMTLSPRAEAP